MKHVKQNKLTFNTIRGQCLAHQSVSNIHIAMLLPGACEARGGVSAFIKCIKQTQLAR
ncbi:hypothetical protein HanXRQr2_Chr07g0284481 [Helianthus annuus]|uniref:Uncharacterized protein n=1 Tax=Helianthus annuus TaxID=4232 RepID=A0A9K3IK06_HELAN|nr:hypothetical protein HanXRQr2_Chr07g0284481 [Helianthus annuus]KAJ0903899.1 hypothetical protein HanPSC8_Chr07g0275381 [Helianthus annuus]